MHRTVGIGRFSVALTFWALTGTASALAQGVAGGLFGATRLDTPGRDRLNVQVSMSESIEREVPIELRPLLPGSDLQSGQAAMLAGSGDYAWNHRRVQLFGTGSSYLRYVHGLDRMAAGPQNLYGGANIRLPKRGNLELSQGATYAPSYFYQLLSATTPLGPGEAVPANPEYRIGQNASYSYNTGMTLGFGSPRETRLTMTAEYRLTDFKAQLAAPPNLETSIVGARLSRALSRTSAVSAGYEYNIAEDGVGFITKSHRATMGVEYTPPLSVSRRAIFRLDLSTSLVESSESAPTGAPTDTARQLYPLQGEAVVEYPFRLGWRAGASYRRSVESVPGLSGAMEANGARIYLNGVIGRRVDVSASGLYASTESAVVSGANHFGTYSGEARIRYALSRAFAVYSEYFHYSYDFSEDAPQAVGVPGVYDQRGIRVGFTFFGQPLR
jgi:hypothetical protein